MGRILVVESDPDLSSLFCLLLEGADHEVVGVTSLPDAQAALVQRRYDLILLEDVSDPPDRTVLCNTRTRLRELAPQVPALLCSCVPGTTRKNADEAGYEGLLLMPFDIDEALAEVGRVIESGAVADLKCSDVQRPGH